MSDEKVPTDKVALTFEGGEYLLEIFGVPLDHRSVKAYVANSFEQAALELITYHENCILHMNSHGTMKPSVYHGAGSDRGKWEHPWMTRWVLENRAQLTRTQQGLLEGIVNMRNHYVDALESSQRFVTSAEPVA